MLFLTLKIKSSGRSLLLKQKILEMWVLASMVLFLWFNLVLVAIFLPRLPVFKNIDRLSFFLFCLMIFLGIDMVIRSMFYKNTGLKILALLLHMTKKQIKQYIILERYFCFSNLSYAVFFIPLALNIIFYSYGFLFWLFCLFLVFEVTVFATLFMLFIKVLSCTYSWVDLLFYGTLVCFWGAMLKYKNVVVTIQNQPLSLLMQICVVLFFVILMTVLFVNFVLTKTLYLDS
jgi:hypothetical protein